MLRVFDHPVIGLIARTQLLLLRSTLAKAEPKTLRYRLLHVAARHTHGQRRNWLRIQHSWPWTPPGCSSLKEPDRSSLLCCS